MRSLASGPPQSSIACLRLGSSRRDDSAHSAPELQFMYLHVARISTGVAGLVGRGEGLRSPGHVSVSNGATAVHACHPRHRNHALPAALWGPAPACRGRAICVAAKACLLHARLRGLLDVVEGGTEIASRAQDWTLVRAMDGAMRVSPLPRISIVLLSA